LRLGLREVPHRLGLEQIHLAVSYRPQGELTRGSEANPRPLRGFYDPTQHKGIPMGADFQHVFTRVRVRRLEKLDYDLFTFFAVRAVPRPNLHYSVLQVRIPRMRLEKPAGNVAALMT